MIPPTAEMRWADSFLGVRVVELIRNNLYRLCQGIHKTLNREMDDRADLIVCYIMSPDQPQKHCTTGHIRRFVV